jgi:hypothetical protein
MTIYFPTNIRQFDYVLGKLQIKTYRKFVIDNVGFLLVSSYECTFTKETGYLNSHSQFVVRNFLTS